MCLLALLTCCSVGIDRIGSALDLWFNSFVPIFLEQSQADHKIITSCVGSVECCCGAKPSPSPGSTREIITSARSSFLSQTIKFFFFFLKSIEREDVTIHQRWGKWKLCISQIMSVYHENQYQRGLEMGCHHSEAMQEKICQQQDGCVLCPCIPQGYLRVEEGRKNHWFLWHRRLGWAQRRCSGDAELCWDSECRYLKNKLLIDQMWQSLNQSWVKTRTLFLLEENPPGCFGFLHVLKNESLILSCPISMSVKDHEVWHLQEGGQEHCFCLALSPCCQLSTMAMQE